MRTITALAVAFLLALAWAPTGSAHFLPHGKHMTTSQKVSYFERSVAHEKGVIRSIERSLAVNHSPFSARDRSRLWHSKRWHRKALRWQEGLLRDYRAKLTVYTSDFMAATQIVGRYYGWNTSAWLQACSSSEGGHGGWVWIGHNTHAIYGRNTPGGWMQFMESTFDANVGWTFADARARGLRVDQRARAYTEPLGQAVVAGAMYAHHGNPSTWTGSRC